MLRYRRSLQLEMLTQSGIGPVRCSIGPARGSIDTAKCNVGSASMKLTIGPANNTGPTRYMPSYGHCLQLDVLNTAGHTAMAYNVSISPSPYSLDFGS